MAADGFVLLHELDDDYQAYEWAIMGIFRGPDGALYWSSDAGCSCYGPWESHDGPGDYTPLVSKTWTEFTNEVASFSAEGPDKVAFLAAARALLDSPS